MPGDRALKAAERVIRVHSAAGARTGRHLRRSASDLHPTKPAEHRSLMSRMPDRVSVTWPLLVYFGRSAPIQSVSRGAAMVLIILTMMLIWLGVYPVPLLNLIR